MGFFQTFIGSFYSATLYRKLRTERGSGLGYSILLVLLTLFIGCALYAPDMNRVHRAIFVGENGRLSAFDDVLRQIAAQTPNMVFQNYTLKTENPGEHVMHLSVDIMGEHVEGEAITIDTSGKTTYANMKTPILATANELIVKTEKETKVRPYTELAKQTKDPKEAYFIDKNEAMQVVKDFSKFINQNLGTFYAVIGSILLLFAIAFLYVMRIIMILLLALCGLLVANIMRKKISFENAMLMCAVSYTPVAMLELVITKVMGGSVGPLILLLCGVITFTAAFVVSNEPEAA